MRHTWERDEVRMGWRCVGFRNPGEDGCDGCDGYIFDEDIANLRVDVDHMLKEWSHHLVLNTLVWFAGLQPKHPHLELVWRPS